MVTMTGILTPSFHVYYSKQLNQLPRSIKIDIWRRLTSRKHPLSIEQASSIHPEVEDLLNKAVENYIKQKERQKMPITSDCETSLRRENEELCISKQVLEKKIEELLDLQEQYKSREIAMTRSLEESGGKVTQLSDSVAFYKSIIPDTKKAIASAEKSINMLENKCRQLEDIISAKDRKIIALADKISSYTRYSDINIEPEIYSSTKERKLWVERRSESEYDLEVRKKYAFRLTSSIALRGDSIH
jgi:vacuolar-type H+-ATPase subunit I/STV1